jgi:undecaprenyl diphosphate synthase
MADSQPLGIAPEKLPGHVAVIMDGNGRWAERQNLPRIEGHRHGVASVRRITEECSRLGIDQLTLYCLSSENWKRPRRELDFLMHLLEQYLIEERSTLMENDLRVSVIGRREGIADGVLREMDKTVEMCEDNHGMRLCLAVNYGGRAELLDAIRAIADEVQSAQIDWSDITEQTISDHLYTAGMSDPDLLIRTAGELRLSNFLLWQISYCEIWVTQHCWPEFEIDDLHQALRDYAARERRFGGL